MSFSSSATVAVEKATSDLLMSPDWTMNIDICDSLNSNNWQAKDVMKALKKRLQHKNPNVQLLSLTVLETMVKNCGEYIHFQIADRNILGEMTKIVKKKADMRVRDKILMLLDSWQEAFGGPGGKHPQYYWAYDELRHFGIEFPKRSLDAAPIFTPPVSHPATIHAQAGYGMPSNSSRRLDETMAREGEILSLSSMDAVHDVMELLADMLQALNPGDSAAVKDEVIVDLVDQCRSNQKKLMQMLTTTGDEGLLGRGLELNDGLQSLLAKHDAIASGSPLPVQATESSSQQAETSAPSHKPTETGPLGLQDRSSRPNNNSSAVSILARSQIDEEEEEEDEFSLIARRHSKAQPIPTQSHPTEIAESVAADNKGNTSTSSMPVASSSASSNELALVDPPLPVRSMKEQDVIDLLSITLSMPSVSPETSSAANENVQVPVYTTQAYPESQGQAPYNNYVVSWAQPQAQLPLQPQLSPQQQLQSRYQLQLQSQQIQPQPQPQLQTQFQSQLQAQHIQPQAQSQHQQQLQSQFQPHLNTQYIQTHPQPQAQQQLQSQSRHQSQAHYNSQQSSGYPAPPWGASAPYSNNQNGSSGPSTFSNSYAHPARSLQHHNSFPAREMNGPAMHGDSGLSYAPRNSVPATVQKPFVPSYRLFEDLNVFGNADEKVKMAGSNASASLGGSSGQGTVGGRKYTS